MLIDRIILKTLHQGRKKNHAESGLPQLNQ